MAREQDDITRKSSLLTEKQKFFDSVYRQYFQKLYAYSRVICNSSDLAEDIISDVFYDLLKGQKDLSQIKDIEAYLFVSVRNRSVKALLKNYKTSSLDDKSVIHHVIDHIDPEALLLERELRETLDNIVDKLPERCQIVFQMAKKNGMKYNEIAAELGISKETVKMQLKRAQRKIRKGLIEFYQEKESHSFADLGLIVKVILLTALPYIDILQ